MKPLRAVLVIDDGVFLVFMDGTTAPLIPGGHANPGGWSSEPVATRRRG